MPKKKQDRQSVDFSDEFNSNLAKSMAKEPDIIHGLYGSGDHSLGVMHTVYSGLPTLDRAVSIMRDTGVYGMPLNRIIECFGGEGSAKSTLAHYLEVSFIKAGGLVYHVEIEKKFDAGWLRRIALMNGVSEELLKSRFRYVDPDHFEAFLKWLLRFMKQVILSKNNAKLAIEDVNKKKRKPINYEELIGAQQKIINTPFLVVVDSIAAFRTKREAEGEEESNDYVGEIARAFNKSLKHIRAYLGYTHTLIFLTNQIRDRIETNQFLAKRMSKIKTPCGNAVKHFSDGRMQMARIGSLKRTRDGINYSVGSIHNVRIVKNAMGVPPFQEAKLRLLNDRGFFSFHSVLKQLVRVGRIKKNGSNFEIKIKDKEIKIRESDADEFADKNPKFCELMHRLYQKHMDQSKGEDRYVARAKSEDD